jgi:hypothetical protein
MLGYLHQVLAFAFDPLSAFHAFEDQQAEWDSEALPELLVLHFDPVQARGEH